MKRSEMLDLLIKVLKKDGTVWAEERAELALSTVEEAGMQPPEWEDFNPPDAERFHSLDRDWTFHGKKKGKNIYSLRRYGCWEDHEPFKK